MGFFKIDSSSDCSRRSFLKGLFGATVVAIATPKVLANGRYVIKLEKRFKPGEFIYVEYGKSIPIHVLNEAEISNAIVAEDVIWDESESALNRRINVMKELMFSVYEKEDKELFDKTLEGLYDFNSALDSALESTFVLLEFMTFGTNTYYNWPEDKKELRSKLSNSLAKSLITNPGFKKWRAIYKAKFSSAHKIGETQMTSPTGWTFSVPIYAEEDMSLHARYVHNPSDFPEFCFTECERSKIMNILMSPTHWLHDKIVS